MIEIVVIGMIWTVQGMVAAILPLKVKWGRFKGSKGTAQLHSSREQYEVCLCQEVCLNFQRMHHKGAHVTSFCNCKEK